MHSAQGLTEMIPWFYTLRVQTQTMKSLT